MMMMRMMVEGVTVMVMKMLMMQMMLVTEVIRVMATTRVVMMKRW